MDDRRFDALTRSLARGASRRRLLQGLTGGLAAVGLGLVGRETGEAFICRQNGVLCAKDAQCCTGVCDPTTHRCAGCSAGQVVGQLEGGGTGCCYPNGTPGVCTIDNFQIVCCAGPQGVGCNFESGNPGTCFTF